MYSLFVNILVMFFFPVVFWMLVIVILASPFPQHSSDIDSLIVSQNSEANTPGDSVAECLSNDFGNEMTNDDIQERTLLRRGQACKASDDPKFNPSRKIFPGVGVQNQNGLNVINRPFTIDGGRCKTKLRPVYGTCGGPKVIRRPYNIMLNCVLSMFLITPIINNFQSMLMLILDSAVYIQQREKFMVAATVAEVCCYEINLLASAPFSEWKVPSLATVI